MNHTNIFLPYLHGKDGGIGYMDLCVECEKAKYYVLKLQEASTLEWNFR